MSVLFLGKSSLLVFFFRRKALEFGLSDLITPAHPPLSAKEVQD
jgi:hypothetical protein